MAENDRKKLLLVEDQAMLAVSEAHLLKKNGYEVVIAKTGEAAVETARGDADIDLILMDIDLGDGIDGTEAARRILSFRALPIVFLTSQIEEEMVERVRNITRYGYVVKDSGEFVLLSSITMAFELFDAHQAAAEKEIRFQNIFEHSRDGIAVFDAVDDGRDFIFLDINNRGEAIENIGKESIVGRSVTEVFPGIKEMGLLGVFKRVYRTGHPEEHNNAYYEDTRISGWRSSYVYLLPGGELVSVFRDMTPEQELREELKTAKNIIEEGSTVAFSWENAEGWPVLYVSNNVKRLFGYDRKAFLDASITYEKIIHPGDRERVGREVREHFEKMDAHTIHHTPYRIVTKKGTVRWVEDRTMLTRDKKGNVLRIDGLISDTTKRKEAEDRLKRSSSELECLHAVSKLVDKKDISLEQVREETVKLIPKYLCRDDRMSVRLSVQDTIYYSENFSDSGPSIREAYSVGGEKVGEWEMFCNHPCGHCCSSYIIEQEKQFLALISERLGKIAERYQAIEQNRTILNAIGAGIILLDEALRIKTMNPAAERLFAVGREEAYGIPLDDVLKKGLREKADFFIEELRSAMEKGPNSSFFSPIELEGGDGRAQIYKPHLSRIPARSGGAVLSFQNVTHEYMQRPDGSSRRVDAIGGVVYDAEGRGTGLQGMVHDVDERTRAEIELREQRELYKAILEASPDAIIQTDLEGTITFCNKQLLKLLHAESKSDIVGTSSFDLIAPQQREKAAQNLGKTLKDGHLAPTDYTILRKDGTTFESRLSVALIKNPEGAPKGFIGIQRDVTDDKILLRSLTENEERFRSIAEQANDGIVMTDESGNITVWNKAYEAITETAAEEVIGKPLWDVQPHFAPPERRAAAVLEAYKKMLKEFFKTGDAPWLDSIEETEMVLAGGRRKIIESKIFRISTNKGFSACSIIRDVTGRKETEKQLKKLLAEKEILLKDVQHRIKNDVNMLYSFIMIQARNQKSPDAKKALQEAANRIAALSGIYENLYRSQEFNEMDTRPLIKGLVTNFMKTSMFSNVTINIEAVNNFTLPARTGVALGVMINELLTNAVKHAFVIEDDEKKIEIGLTSERQNTLELFVRDNGRGMPETVLHGNDKGFGLSITESLVKQYEGIMECSNNAGTRVNIRMKSV